MIKDKDQEKLFYEVCYFDNKKNYLCEIILTIFEENKIIQNKVVLSDDTIHSYPQVIKVSDGKYILSITNNGKSPKIFELKKNELIFKNIPINENIMDATYFYHDELYYMIGTDYSLKGDGNLRIFYGKDPTKDMFIEHPSSPIKYGKNQNRISGSIFKMNNKIYRFAMNNEKEYGEYVNLYEILELNKTKFSEKLIKKNILLNTNLPNNIKKYHHISLKDSNYEGEGEIEFLIDGANISYLGMHGKKISNKNDISE